MTAPRARAWRKIIAKGAGAFLLLMLALSLGWLTRPSQVADLILDRLGNALGLEITASGASEYHLRGTPRLVVRDLVARQPGADTAVLTAERVYFSLPWTTLRAAGDDLTVKRVEVNAPRLDIVALQRWLDSRPTGGDIRIPTLTDGLQILRGEIISPAWSIDRLSLDLASLHPDQPLAARLGGRFNKDGISAPFDLQLALTRPTLEAGVGVAGIATVIASGWRVPMQLQLSTRLHNGDDGIGLDRAKLGMDASWLGSAPGDEPLAFTLGLAGTARYRDGRLLVAPLGVAARGTDIVPHVDANGRFVLDATLSAHLTGVIADWPVAWPALPSPLDQSDSPLPFVLDYTGPASLDGDIDLQLQRDALRFDGRFRLPRILDWLEQRASGTPLPPLDGTLTVPTLTIAGATLTGVEIEFDDSDEQLPR
ncbi:MAG: hypothetical protein ACOH1P_11100 [Lysobacter sp.]